MTSIDHIKYIGLNKMMLLQLQNRNGGRGHVIMTVTCHSPKNIHDIHPRCCNVRMLRVGQRKVAEDRQCKDAEDGAT